MKKNGKSLELYFINGKPDGMLTATVPFQWTGHILMINRNQITEALNRDETSRTGVYILIGEDEKGSLAYIGETEEIRQRIKQHAKNKDWWSSAILITDTGNELNKAHVKYIESRLIEVAMDVGKINLENATIPPTPSLSESQKSNMEGFIENILIVLPALRIDFFLTDTIPEKKSNDGIVAQKKLPTFELFTKKHGIKAIAILDGSDFIVQAGSLAKLEWAADRKNKTSYWKIHDDLSSRGILINDGAHKIFTKNYKFTSPSAAAAVINGRSSNGRKAWKVIGTKQTYHDWETSELADTRI